MTRYPGNLLPGPTLICIVVKIIAYIVPFRLYSQLLKLEINNSLFQRVKSGVCIIIFEEFMMAYM